MRARGVGAWIWILAFTSLRLKGLLSAWGGPVFFRCCMSRFVSLAFIQGARWHANTDACRAKDTGQTAKDHLLLDSDGASDRDLRAVGLGAYTSGVFIPCISVGLGTLYGRFRLPGGRKRGTAAVRWTNNLDDDHLIMLCLHWRGRLHDYPWGLLCNQIGSVALNHGGRRPARHWLVLKVVVKRDLVADERRVPFGHALSAYRDGIGVAPGVSIDGLAECSARHLWHVAVCLHLVGSGASGVLVFPSHQNANGILLNREMEHSGLRKECLFLSVFGKAVALAAATACWLLVTLGPTWMIAAGWPGAIVAPGGTGVSQ